MEIPELVRPFWFIVLFLNLSECDWLNCGHIDKCHCKWSSGKKTASCTSAALINLPRLSPDIQVLDLYGNPLRELAKGAFTDIDLLNLQRLNLSDTKLKRIHNNAFRELRILIELDLSHNELHYLSPNVFDGIDRLRHLILYDNPLREFHAEQFPILHHLKKLEISKCQLQKLHPLAFSNLRVLETIHAHQNLLSYVHVNTFNLPFLKTLTLSDNPWYCDCRLRDFHEWFLNANLGNEEVLCVGPNNYANVSWRYIRGNELVCPPSAVSSPTVLRAEVGAEITFGCFVSGDPKPNASWYLGNNEIQNLTTEKMEIKIIKQDVIEIDEFNNDFINKSSQWVNVSLSNITDRFSGEWICNANSFVGEASASLTLFLSTPRTATARSAPEFPKFIVVILLVLSITLIGFITTCICWKTRRRRLTPSKSFTDQEKKLLDSSMVVSDRQSVDLSSSYGFEMLDRSTSIDSSNTQRCLDTLQITLETSGQFPSPPIEFTIPSSFSNIFISVQLTDNGDGNSDILRNERNLSHCSRPYFLESTNDHIGTKFRNKSCSTLSFLDNNTASRTMERNLKTSLSSFSTEFTAL